MYPKQVNIVFQSDIYFAIDEFNIFINKDADMQYITFKEKDIVELFNKKVLKVVILKIFQIILEYLTFVLLIK